jgi:hypothetical protein
LSLGPQPQGYNDVLESLKELDPCPIGGVKVLVHRFDEILHRGDPASAGLISEFDLSGLLISRMPGDIFDEFLDFHAGMREAPYEEVKMLLMRLDENHGITMLLREIGVGALGECAGGGKPEENGASTHGLGEGYDPQEPEPKLEREPEEQSALPRRQRRVLLRPAPVNAASASTQTPSQAPQDVPSWYREFKINQPQQVRPTFPVVPLSQPLRPPLAPPKQRRGPPPEDLCYNCWLPGHPTFDCPYPHNSQTERHRIRLQRGYKQRKMSCWNCSATSHLAEDCREPNRRSVSAAAAATTPAPVAVPQRRVCWNCWEWGHSAVNCTDTLRSWSQREALRLRKNGPATSVYRSMLGQSRRQGALLR